MTDIIDRLRKYAGKDCGQVSKQCLTVRETIEVANYIVKLEAELYRLRPQSPALFGPGAPCTPCLVCGNPYGHGGLQCPYYKAVMESAPCS